MEDCDDTKDFPKNVMPAIRRVMRPQDTNALGSIFGGVILSEIDLAAAITAHRLHPDRLVTVAMDKVEFKHPVFVGDLVSLFGTVTRVGRSSITVDISVWAERRLSGYSCCHVTQATVTMVAVDEEYNPIPVALPDQTNAE
jgi:acyl-CoA thioesterase YciA